MKILKKVYHLIYQQLSHKAQNKIVFFHIPKCGGTSIGNAFIENSICSRLCGKGLTKIDSIASKRAARLVDESLQEYRRKILVYILSQSNNWFVRGHVSINKEIIKEFIDDWNFVTILRDPVERWYSEYFFNKYKDSEHFKTDMELVQYLDSKRGIKSGYSYISYFSGVKGIDDSAIEQAKNNLRNFRIVGLLEDLKRFKEEVYSEFNINLSIPHKNESPAPRHVMENIPPHIHRQVIKICEPNQRIYDWAKNNIVEVSQN